MDMNELVKTVTSIVLESVSAVLKKEVPRSAAYRMIKWLMTRNKPMRALPIQL